MRLSGRVKTLERRIGVNAVCPVCAGRGHPGSAMRINGVEHGLCGGCVRCNKMSGIKVIVLDYETEEEAEQARSMWPPGLEAGT